MGGASATRFGTVVTAPLIPRQSEGRGPILPQPPISLFPLLLLLFSTSTFDPLRIQEDKEKSKPLETKNKQNAVGWRAGGAIQISQEDAKGHQSNFITPLFPTSTSGTRIGCSSSCSFNGCLSVVCCSPSRDMSLVAGSRDTSLVALPLPASSSSPSVCSSTFCSRCLSHSVCLCRDYEKPQG